MLNQNAPVRQQHDLIQGSYEWHEFRSKHIGASEIAAVLGLSKYTSRTELLKIKSTGITPEIDPGTQRIFDRGHETEALARPIAEAIIGDELYPTTWSYVQLSASCDGLNMMETIGFEHKQFNAALFEQVSLGELPDTHMPQVQQCLLVTGAEKWLFMVSDGTEENCAHMWVYPEQSWFDRIEAAAEQFYTDLETYQPEPEVIEAKADPVMALPALAIQVGGSISIQSNLEKFGERLKGFITETNAKPETDQDFANLEQACKVLKEAEDALKQAESNALAQTASVDEMRRTVAFLADMARTNRLQFEKLVKSEKEARKVAIVSKAKIDFGNHLNDLQDEIKGVALIVEKVVFADAIKGKKTLSSMQDAVNTMLANAKIEADRIAKDLRANLALINGQPAHRFLFNDIQTIAYKPFDDLKLIVETRIEQHQKAEAAKLEAERERIRLEEESKARREAEAKVRAEQQAKARAMAAIEEQAYRDKLERENQEELEHAQAQAQVEEEKPLDIAADSQSVVQAFDPANDQGNTAQSVESAQQPEKNIGVLSSELQSQEEKAPPRHQIIMAVASKFFVTFDVAEKWLVAEFSNQSIQESA